MKKYIKYAAVFILAGIVCGVFFREFSKAYGVINTYTVLGLVHPHFLTLGGIFTLVMGLVAEKLELSENKMFKTGFRIYSLGVLFTGVMLLIRGIFDVLIKSEKEFTFTKGANAAIAGMAGIFHAVLGIGLLLVFISWLRSNFDSPDSTKKNGKIKEK